MFSFQDLVSASESSKSKASKSKPDKNKANKSKKYRKPSAQSEQEDYSKNSKNYPQVNPIEMCKDESFKRLTKLEFKGENRFSDIRTLAEEARVEDAEFSDMGSAGKSRKKRREAGHNLNGQMVFMEAQGKEKLGWRNLKVRCGVARGKLITFTYEIHEIKGDVL